MNLSFFGPDLTEDFEFFRKKEKKNSIVGKHSKDCKVGKIEEFRILNFDLKI